PIIPMSAHHEVNVDTLIETIEKVIPSRKFDETKPAKMYIARSFDVNQPGSTPDKFVGGVVGGTLLSGKLKVGDEIEIRPGRQAGTGTKTEWVNIESTIRSLQTGGQEGHADMNLKIPVASEAGQRIAVSRRIGGKWRLIGYGVIR